MQFNYFTLILPEKSKCTGNYHFLFDILTSVWVLRIPNARQNIFIFTFFPQNALKDRKRVVSIGTNPTFKAKLVPIDFIPRKHVSFCVSYG